MNSNHKTLHKQQLRQQIKNLKSLLTDSDRHQAAEAVFAALERTAAFLLADRILMYHSLPDELSTHAFLNKWCTRKQFFLPRVAGVNLELLPYRPGQLGSGSYHIAEPTGSDVVAADTMELIVVPGVAFDRRGNRLGRGKGFYDRLLAETRATTVGVGYDFQLQPDDLPAEEHDAPLDMIITETASLLFHHPRRPRK